MVALRSGFKAWEVPTQPALPTTLSQQAPLKPPSAKPNVSSISLRPNAPAQPSSLAATAKAQPSCPTPSPDSAPPCRTRSRASCSSDTPRTSKILAVSLDFLRARPGFIARLGILCARAPSLLRLRTSCIPMRRPFRLLFSCEARLVRCRWTRADQGESCRKPGSKYYLCGKVLKRWDDQSGLVSQLRIEESGSLYTFVTLRFSFLHLFVCLEIFDWIGVANTTSYAE